MGKHEDNLLERTDAIRKSIGPVGKRSGCGRWWNTFEWCDGEPFNERTLVCDGKRGQCDLCAKAYKTFVKVWERWMQDNATVTDMVDARVVIEEREARQAIAERKGGCVMISRYKPLSYQTHVSYKALPWNCCAAVHDNFGVGYHQCLRKPTMVVEGMELCTQHGNMKQKEIDAEGGETMSEQEQAELGGKRYWLATKRKAAEYDKLCAELTAEQQAHKKLKDAVDRFFVGDLYEIHELMNKTWTVDDGVSVGFGSGDTPSAALLAAFAESKGDEDEGGEAKLFVDDIYPQAKQDTENFHKWANDSKKAVGDLPIGQDVDIPPLPAIDEGKPGVY